jgi:thymidine phosphorylase
MMSTVPNEQRARLTLRSLAIDTYQDFVIYMHRDCHVCRAEGFEAQSRVQVTCGTRQITATLHVASSPVLEVHEAGLSRAAWNELGAQPGDEITVSHAPLVESLSALRSKVYGHALNLPDWQRVIGDVTAGRYSDLQLAALVTACAGDRMSEGETIALTQAMVDAGTRLHWNATQVLDKHCIGGLPGNRTTLIVVPIVAAAGFVIPKTSSRAITSPAGTADTMETLAPVTLSIEQMRRVVERELGCIVWGGTARLSPADDVLIRVERPLDFDSDGQMVASILSKKLAAGATHVLIDIPIGPTAKVRTAAAADRLANRLTAVASALNLKLAVEISNGAEPVGRGIGPALEARDVLAVLRGEANAPADLRARALTLAARILEFAPSVAAGAGRRVAEEILASGRAWQKFQAICEAQGGMREIPRARVTSVIAAQSAGVCIAIDNRRIARAAKLAGAPRAPAAGIDLHVRVGDRINKDQPLFTLHADAHGELDYALKYLQSQTDVVSIGAAT